MDRKLAVILAADVVGYSHFAALDEEGTLLALARRRTQLEESVKRHGGRVFGSAGDGFVAEFASAVQAVRASIDIQRHLDASEATLRSGQRLEFRIGLNLGDVVVSGNDLLGDGVNVAARLQEIARPSGICISGSVREHLDGKVAVKLTSLGERRLKNIPRPVSVFEVDWKEPLPLVDQAAPNVSVRYEKPSLAILPLANLSPDPEQGLFADGLVDEIINKLSYLSGLEVISSSSSFRYRGRETDLRTVAGELGVRYVMEGSLQKSGNRIRVAVRLADTRSGNLLWSERYDRELADIFAIQDDIAVNLVNAMLVLFSGGEWERLLYTSTGNVDAWTLYIKGLAEVFWPTRTRIPGEDVAAALRHLHKALSLDPGSAQIHAIVAGMHALAARYRWWGERSDELRTAAFHAERALELDSENALAWSSSGLVRWVEGRFEEAVVLARKALNLAPGHPLIATDAGAVLTATGHADEAVAAIEKAIRLNPFYPPMWLGFLGNAYRLAGRTDQAIATFEEYSKQNPASRDLVIAYQRAGRQEDAKRAAQRLMAASPDFTIARWIDTQFRSDKEEFEADIAALRAAGLT